MTDPRNATARSEPNSATAGDLNTLEEIVLFCKDHDRTVLAVVIGPLAVHRSLWHAEMWTITHIASGLWCPPEVEWFDGACDLATRLAAIEGWDHVSRDNRAAGGAMPALSLVRGIDKVVATFRAWVAPPAGRA